MLNISKLTNILLDKLEDEICNNSDALSTLKDRILEPIKINLYPHIYPIIAVSYAIIAMLTIILILVLIILFIFLKKY